MDPAVTVARDRHKRNLLATLMLSQGVPMLLAGDEFGRTQMGNNNAYCQDNEINWIDWSLLDSRAGAGLKAFFRYLVELRDTWPLLHWHLFFHDHGDGEYSTRCLWLNASGRQMSAADWQNPGLSGFAMHLLGPAAIDDDQREQMLALFNADARALNFVMPGRERKGRWQRLLCTDSEDYASDVPDLRGGVGYRASPQSVALFRFISMEYQHEQ